MNIFRTQDKLAHWRQLEWVITSARAKKLSTWPLAYIGQHISYYNIDLWRSLKLIVSLMSLYRVWHKLKILALLNKGRITTLVLAEILKVTNNHLNWITITKDLDAHSLILSSQHSDPKWSNHNEAKIDGKTWLLISFRSESFIFTLGEGKVNIFQSTLWIPQYKICRLSCNMAGSEKHFFSTLIYLQKL